MWHKIRGNFIAGVAVILPLVITIWVFTFLYRWISGRLIYPLTALFTPYIANPYLEYAVSIAIFFLLISGIIAIGVATRIIFFRRIFASGEKIFFKIPLAGKIYVALKQISQAFLGRKRAAFKNVVLIEFPRKGMYAIGFVTAEHGGEIEEKVGKKLISVYIASVPNPATGFFFLVPEDEIIILKMSVEDAMKLALSGGAVTPHDVDSADD